jgi:RNA polymerase sigma-70 factor (ECF subfamily)
MPAAFAAVRLDPTGEPSFAAEAEPRARSAAAQSDGLDDAALVAAALRGERAAEERLYRRHVPAVAAVAVRLLGRGAEAEDVVQDSFVIALERLAQLRDPELFRAWVVRIAVRCAHRRFRRRRLLGLLGLARGEDAAGLAEQAAPSLPAERRVELVRLDAVLRALPSDQRVVWVLRHVEGYELSELAVVCGVSLATVKRWLQRAEARVRAQLGGEP